MEDEDKMTDEQIENWRKVLAMTLGPYAYMMTKEEVQKHRDRMQKHIDEDL